MKLASPRLNVLILVALSFTHIGPLLFALVLSANDYNMDMPLGGNILCGVCVCFVRSLFSMKIEKRALRFIALHCLCSLSSHVHIIIIHQIFFVNTLTAFPRLNAD